MEHLRYEKKLCFKFFQKNKHKFPQLTANEKLLNSIFGTQIIKFTLADMIKFAISYNDHKIEMDFSNSLDKKYPYKNRCMSDPYNISIIQYPDDTRCDDYVQIIKKIIYEAK